MIRKAVILVLTLAAVATGVAWRLSYLRTSPGPLYGTTIVGSSPDDPIHGLLLESGKFGVLRWTKADADVSKFRRSSTRFAGFSHGIGIMYNAEDGTPNYYLRNMWCPLWFPFLLFAAYPTFVLIRGPLRRRYSRRYRREHGLCVTCRYNLTGNVSGICPECSQPIPEEQRKTTCEPKTPIGR